MSETPTQDQSPKPKKPIFSTIVFYGLMAVVVILLAGFFAPVRAFFRDAVNADLVGESTPTLERQSSTIVLADKGHIAEADFDLEKGWRLLAFFKAG
ncbi:MAG: hypothetical protein KDB07_00570 [Planctomycetes bacterium]|nr:hypothetical protein [Planctomycetota bacterium]